MTGLDGTTPTGAPNNSGTIFAMTLPQPGDANADGKVDINDLTIVLTNFGQTDMTWYQGDFLDTGTVDVNDLTIVLQGFGQTTALSGSSVWSAVPEPCA